jgi:hypothetical protein
METLRQAPIGLIITLDEQFFKPKEFAHPKIPFYF